MFKTVAFAPVYDCSVPTGKAKRNADNKVASTYLVIMWTCCPNKFSQIDDNEVTLRYYQR